MKSKVPNHEKIHTDLTLRLRKEQNHKNSLVMAQRIRKTPEELKRKYNATYRLRKKLGTTVFPSRSKIIFHADDLKMQNEPEVKILLSEFEFIIQPNCL